jgi:hypothetical protein
MLSVDRQENLADHLRSGYGKHFKLKRVIILFA